MHYLPPEHWSPRFDSVFFTAEIISWTSLSTPPNEDSFQLLGQSGCNGLRETFPAIYYTIEIRFGHERILLMRRFSQFYTFYKQIIQMNSTQGNKDGTTEDGTKIIAPKKLCPFSILTDEILDTRLELLNNFLRDILRRPNMTLNPIVITFLALDQLETIHTNVVS